MIYFVLHIPLLPVPGMALFPCILLKEKRYKSDRVLINHEVIHLKQQLEMFIIPFYIFYLLNYLLNLVKYKDHYKAYIEIVFEREAFLNEKDLFYPTRRRFWSWINYFGQ